MKLWYFFVRLKNLILSFVYPDFCLGCGKEGKLVCEKCKAAIQIIENDVCPSCRKESAGGFFCGGKCGEGFYFEALIVALPYLKSGLMSKAIARFKYHFSENLSEFLGDILRLKFLESSGVFLKNEMQECLIVPVPLHKNRLKYRGFNQAEMLCKALGEPRNILERVVETSEQALLSRLERIQNVKGAFAMKDVKKVRENCFVRGKTICLVDDVATTLSTLNECSKILKAAGATRIICLVLARGV